ncbi:MAG TPA: rod shape-determining protein RodA [Candidatus Omnitrophota bacterium]|nr:rod shape-determining protein RodA [Candidatus Omnitrophota bacterium]HPS37345.1 rod shape-determining protein RodA [Candidatus Omnitrophota bacterium]
MLRRLFRGIHLPLVFSVLALAMIGLLFIYSASYRDAGQYEVKQLFWIAVGLAVLVGVPWIGYRPFLSISYLFYIVTIILLAFVDFLGSKHLGAQRWLDLGPLSIQPSEFAKLGTMLAVVNFLGSHHPWEGQTRTVATALFLLAVPFMLIVKQPDLGTALLFIPMSIVMLYLWGVRKRFLFTVFGSLALAVPLAWEFLKGYQKKRLLVFLNPNLDPLGSGYTALQAKIAVGSGGLWGKGYLAGTQTQLHFVPEHHTDFIFCVIGEEWGFLGSLLVLCLYGALFHAIFLIMQHTTDVKAKLLCGGVLALLFSHVMINIGMTFGLMPIAGLPLPLVSYGGSSFIMTCMALGLVLSVYRERSIF